MQGIMSVCAALVSVYYCDRKRKNSMSDSLHVHNYEPVYYSIYLTSYFPTCLYPLWFCIKCDIVFKNEIYF